jgi:predicted ATPase
MGKQLVESRREVDDAGIAHYIAKRGPRSAKSEPSRIDDGDDLPVNEPASNPTAPALIPLPFVGREIEMGGLGASLNLAGAGRGRLVLITGEPGIGKSRLMEELSNAASELGWRVLLGRCWEGGGAPAYWPWIQVVQQAGGQFEQFVIRQEQGAAQPTRRVAPGRTSTNDPETVRFSLFESVAGFLTGVSHDQPLLVVLDDIHVADEPSLLLLRFLAEIVGRQRILILASYREGDRGVHQLADAFGQLVRVGHRISVRGLSSSDVAIYIQGVTGETPSELAVTRIRDITAGNPFFLSEVVRTLLVDGRLTENPEAVTDPRLRIPEEVRVLIRRRVAGLSREAGSTLRLAAVLGREFDLNMLDHAGRLSVGRLLDVLSEAVAARVIMQDTANPSRYAFAHDLVRETLYEGMPAARRLELHRTIGRVLEDMYRDNLDPHLAELAHHFTEAAPPVRPKMRPTTRSEPVITLPPYWRTRTLPSTIGPPCRCFPCSSTPALSGAARYCSASATPSGGQETRQGLARASTSAPKSLRAPAWPSSW